MCRFRITSLLEWLPFRFYGIGSLLRYDAKGSHATLGEADSEFGKKENRYTRRYIFGGHREGKVTPCLSELIGLVDSYFAHFRQGITKEIYIESYQAIV